MIKKSTNQKQKKFERDINREKKDVSPELEKQLKTAIEEFKQGPVM